MSTFLDREMNNSEPICWHELHRLAIGLFAYVVLSLQFVSSASAQANPGHSGGQHLKVGQKHIEFVGGTADTALIFVVTTEKDSAVQLRGGKIRLTIEHHGRMTNVPVVVDGVNMFVARLKQPLPKGARISVSVQLAEGNPLSAHFTAN